MCCVISALDGERERMEKINVNFYRQKKAAKNGFLSSILLPIPKRYFMLKKVMSGKYVLSFY